MGNDLVVYKQVYKVIFKDKRPPVIISKEKSKEVISCLLNNKFVELGDEAHSPFIIEEVIKFNMTDSIENILSAETETIQKVVRGFMKTYKKDITPGVLENMIKKAKGEN